MSLALGVSVEATVDEDLPCKRAPHKYLTSISQRQEDAFSSEPFCCRRVYSEVISESNVVSTNDELANWKELISQSLCLRSLEQL